jgi:hypothetical protein
MSPRWVAVLVQIVLARVDHLLDLTTKKSVPLGWPRSSPAIGAHIGQRPGPEIRSRKPRPTPRLFRYPLVFRDLSITSDRVRAQGSELGRHRSDLGHNLGRLNEVRTKETRHQRRSNLGDR